MTYVDIFGQELIRDAVFIDDIVVHASAGRRRTEEEAEKTVGRLAFLSNDSLMHTICTSSKMACDSKL